MDFETIFRYFGVALALSASIYLIYSGQKKLGVLFLLGFMLELQGWLYIESIGYPETMGECWATKQDYYSCLPFATKLSTYLSQFGIYLIALSVFLIAKNFNLATVHNKALKKDADNKSSAS